MISLGAHRSRIMLLECDCKIRFKTGIDVAKYTAAIMRKDMDDYDAEHPAILKSLGCWHGFIGQQKMISIKKHFGTMIKNIYIYQDG